MLNFKTLYYISNRIRSIFKTAPRMKFNRKHFQDELYKAYFSGMIEANLETYCEMKLGDFTNGDDVKSQIHFKIDAIYKKWKKEVDPTLIPPIFDDLIAVIEGLEVDHLEVMVKEDQQFLIKRDQGMNNYIFKVKDKVVWDGMNGEVIRTVKHGKINYITVAFTDGRESFTMDGRHILETNISDIISLKLVDFHEDQTYTDPKINIEKKSDNPLYQKVDDTEAHVRINITDGGNGNGLTHKELIESFEPYINSLIDKRLMERNVQTFEMNRDYTNNHYGINSGDASKKL